MMLFVKRNQYRTFLIVDKDFQDKKATNAHKNELFLCFVFGLCVCGVLGWGVPLVGVGAFVFIASCCLVSSFGLA